MAQVVTPISNNALKLFQNWWAMPQGDRAAVGPAWGGAGRLQRQRYGRS